MSRSKENSYYLGEDRENFLKELTRNRFLDGKVVNDQFKEDAITEMEVVFGKDPKVRLEARMYISRAFEEVRREWESRTLPVLVLA